MVPRPLLHCRGDLIPVMDSSTYKHEPVTGQYGLVTEATASFKRLHHVTHGEEVCCGLHFRWFLEIMDIVSSELKKKMTIQTDTCSKFNPASVIPWGCVSAHGMGNLHICEGTINAER